LNDIKIEEKYEIKFNISILATYRYKQSFIILYYVQYLNS